MLVDRHRDMDVFVSVDPTITLLYGVSDTILATSFLPLVVEHQPAGWADKTVTSRYSTPGPYWVTALPDGWLLEQAAGPGPQINAKALCGRS